LTRKFTQGPQKVCRTLLQLPGRIFKFKSLKLKLMAASLTLASVILLVTYVTLSSSARTVAAEQSEKHVKELLLYFSGIVAESVAANDRLQVQFLGQALLTRGIGAVCITGSSGQVLYASQPDLEQEGVFSSPDVKPYAGGILGTRDGHSLLQGAAPIRLGSTPLGMIHVWMQCTDLETEIQEAHAFVYPVFALGFFLLLLLGTVSLNIPFHTLKGLTQAANRIGAGNFSERVPVVGEDELSAFCQTFNTMVDGLCKARSEILQGNLETIRAMISTVEAKDPYTQGHCVRVQSLVGKLLERLPGAPAKERTQIETSALLHDIGKIGVPDSLLLKEGRLTNEEIDVIRSHATIGEKILLHLDSMKTVARWVRHHHERWDGLGYPDGLRGEAIPFASRVIGVADAIDAMSSTRPYRQSRTREEVVEVLKECRGTQFDPQIADCAIQLLEVKERQTVEVLA
jgi:putative nucleotidyltransferase with HDIG domain